MKKGFIILIIFVIFSIASFFPVTQNSTIDISATFDNTILQIVHIENWKNWYPDIKESYTKNADSYSIEKDSSQKIYTIKVPDEKYIIQAITPMSYKINEEGSRMKDNFAFTVFPGGASGKMKIFLVNKTPLIFALLKSKNPGEDALNGLKSYLEDPKAFYGFDIQMAAIRDSVIASKVFRAQKKDIFFEIQNAYKDLMKYLNTQSLTKTGHVSISYISIPGDSLQITVGVPVNKLAAPGNGIQCLSLPAKGRVLVGTYQGKFSERKKIYIAMSKYLTDHTLSIPAESFERYLNDSIPTSGSFEIKMELNYPVY